MTKVEIEKSIFQETQELSLETLREILDFIQFLKAKQSCKAKKVDMLAVLPKHQLGKIRGSLRREDMYADAR